METGNKTPDINILLNMKNLKYLFSLFLLVALGCSQDDNGTEYLDNVGNPSNISAIFTIAEDNSGKVTIRPNADGVTQFEIYYGDTTVEPAVLTPGQTVTHTYTNGVYTVKITGMTVNGLKSEFTQQITVTIIPPPDPLILPVTFESATLNYAFGDFGGVTTSIVDNPSTTGNSSAKVGKMVKSSGSEVWAGTSLGLDQPIDFSTMQKITIKIFSPIAGAIVKLKLENFTNADINTELDAVTTVANQWETLTYNFTGINNANNYQRLVLFYDYGNTGNGSEFYFDDVEQSAGEAQVGFPLTFENSSLTYTFTGFGGANAEVIANPDATGINTSAKVGKMTKNAGAETYAGAFIVFPQPIDFSAQQKIKIKVWSPQAGITVKIKLEHTPATPIEKDAVTTITNGWEELTYDFTGIVNANNYNTVTLFFEFGATGSGTTYYFDDLKLAN